MLFGLIFSVYIINFNILDWVNIIAIFILFIQFFLILSLNKKKENIVPDDAFSGDTRVLATTDL